MPECTIKELELFVRKACETGDPVVVLLPYTNALAVRTNQPADPVVPVRRVRLEQVLMDHIHEFQKKNEVLSAGINAVNASSGIKALGGSPEQARFKQSGMIWAKHIIRTAMLRKENELNTAASGGLARGSI